MIRKLPGAVGAFMGGFVGSSQPHAIFYMASLAVLSGGHPHCAPLSRFSVCTFPCALRSLNQDTNVFDINHCSQLLFSVLWQSLGSCVHTDCLLVILLCLICLRPQESVRPLVDPAGPHRVIRWRWQRVHGHHARCRPCHCCWRRWHWWCW